MKHPKDKPPHAAAPFHDVDLLRLELLIAKRADRLWRTAGYTRGKDLLHWLQAEREILEGDLMTERPQAEALAASR